MANWLTESEHAYSYLYNFYDGNKNLPRYNDEVFFGYSGCVRQILLVTLNAMRENWGLNWYNTDNVNRQAIFSEIAAEIWVKSGFSFDVNALIKFQNWVFVAAQKTPQLLNYLKGGSFSDFVNVKTAITDVSSKVSSGISNAVDVVKEIITIPSESVNLVARIAPAVKWAAIIWGASKIIKAIKA